jgi:hypothetical protein
MISGTMAMSAPVIASETSISEPPPALACHSTVTARR